MKTKSIQLPEEAWHSLEIEAQKENTSVAAIIRRIIINPNKRDEKMEHELERLKIENNGLKKELEISEKYRALHEERLDRVFDMINKSGVWGKTEKQEVNNE